MIYSFIICNVYNNKQVHLHGLARDAFWSGNATAFQHRLFTGTRPIKFNLGAHFLVRTFMGSHFLHPRPHN